MLAGKPVPVFPANRLGGATGCRVGADADNERAPGRGAGRGGWMVYLVWALWPYEVLAFGLGFATIYLARRDGVRGGS